MKSIFFLILGFFGILNAAFGQKTVNHVQLVGNIKGVGNSKLFICKIEGFFMNAQVIDSFTCKNDSFNYRTNFKTNDNLYCIKDAYGQLLYFFPDTEKITINGSSDNLIFSSIVGSENNAILTDYWKIQSLISNQNMPLYSSLKKAQEEHDTIKISKIRKQQDSLFSIVRSQPEKFITIDHDKNASAAILYLNLTQFRLEKINVRSLYEKLDKQVQDSPVGKRINDFITSLDACRVGKPFIDFELADQENKSVMISSLKGKYFLIEFWASWCGPCIGELPTLSKAYEKYNIKGFEIISISLDNSKQQWMNALQRHKTQWLQTINKNSERFMSNFAPFGSDVAKAYSILYVPANYLIDPNGLIIATDLRGEDLTNKLSEIYK